LFWLKSGHPIGYRGDNPSDDVQFPRVMALVVRGPNRLSIPALCLSNGVVIVAIRWMTHDAPERWRSPSVKRGSNRSLGNLARPRTAPLSVRPLESVLVEVCPSCHHDYRVGIRSSRSRLSINLRLTRRLYRTPIQHLAGEASRGLRRRSS